MQSTYDNVKQAANELVAKLGTLASQHRDVGVKLAAVEAWLKEKQTQVRILASAPTNSADALQRSKDFTDLLEDVQSRNTYLTSPHVHFL